MPQQSHVPTRKVTVGALGGACAAIGAWLLAEFAGVDMPPGIEGAVATIVAAVLAYVVPEPLIVGSSKEPPNE